MDIIAQGDIAKYQVQVNRDGFDRETSRFEITLSWGRFGDSVAVPQSSMFHDEEGRMFFFFDTSGMFGPVIATCRYSVSDDDMTAEDDEEASGTWQCLDRQVICYVEPVPGCGCTHCDADCSDRHVRYARIFRADANTAYEILRDSEENILLDNDGYAFRVKKSNLI